MSDDTRWELLSAGRVVAVESADVPNFPDEVPLEPMAIEPEGLGRYSALLDALDALTRMRGVPTYHPLSLYVAAGPRRALWGGADRGVEHALVEALNDVAGRGEPVAIVLDGAQNMDAASLRLVLRAANRPGWLRVPLMLVFHTLPDQGPVRQAADALGAQPMGTTESAPVSVEVPEQHRPMLRAAAWLGSPFSAKALAALTDQTPLRVLLALQSAADQGVPVSDNGGGQFTLPDTLADALSRDLLPSLTEAWVALDLDGRIHDDNTAEGTGLSAARRAWLAGRHIDALAFAGRAVDTDDDEQAVGALADLTWFNLQTGNAEAALDAANQLVRLTGSVLPDEPNTQSLILRAMVLQALGNDHLAGALADVRAASERVDDPVDKALLLADEAALAVHAGDVPEAARCLSRARALIRDDADERAILAVAETNLLTGRLPLHRSGRVETPVLASAARHARKAVDAWESRGMSTELAVVSRTLGDLEHRASRPSSAMKRYSEAVQLQREIGDDVGLAITTHSLAGVLAEVGSLNEAVSVLADSVGLNVRTGTEAALRQNDATVDVLRAHSLGNAGVQRALDTLSERIEGAIQRASAVN